MLTVTAAASSDALTTLAAVKAELGITATTDDTHLTTLVTAASATIASVFGLSTLGRQTLLQTERLTDYTSYILLERGINPTITTVTVDGEALESTDWEMDCGILFRLSDDSRIYWSPGKIEIAYASGYSLPSGAPADLARACILTVSAWYAARGRDPLLRSQAHEGAGAESYLDPKPGVEVIPPQAMSLIAPVPRFI